MGGTNGGYVGAALGAAGGSALGNKISKDRYTTKSSKHWKKTPSSSLIKFDKQIFKHLRCFLL